MPEVELMREVLKDGGDGEMVPCVLWGYSEADGIHIMPVLGNDVTVADYRARVLDAKQREFSDRAIWDYWTKNGGNGYFSLRMLPKIVQADSLDQAMRREIDAWMV